MLYADVIVDISHEKVDKPFQYAIPDKLNTKLAVGRKVFVPFGRWNKLIEGYVIAITDKCNYDPAKIKEIYSISQSGVDVESKLIALACWIHENYGSTMIQALKTVLPAKRSVEKLMVRKVVRKGTNEELIHALGEAKRRKNQTAKARLLEELLTNPILPYEWITGKLGVSAATIRSLERAELLTIVSEDTYRNPVGMRLIDETKQKLSPAQQKIVEEFISDYDADRRNTYLIHGITGSGKTEVYMALIEQVVARGKQAIFLIPEIALTYQTLVRFYKRFGDRVSLINSTLSAGEKYDQCERAKNREIDVIIGPRSALFTPFPEIGLIVIDEEHESSYKSETTPKYHARETALEVARLHGASVVLGSATPSLESYYRAVNGQYKLFTLKERLTGGTLPKVYITDLREELKAGNRSIFSSRLKDLLAERLEKKEQSMLFLNRRGYAGFITCRSCGYVVKCPHCDVSLSEHSGGRLICHYCGYEMPRLKTCPQCGSKYISGFRAGTQQIEEKLKELFPQIRVLRMDADTTRQKGSFEKILAAFRDKEADVLIGTQMIVKGHDFPNVTLVGIIAADLSLSVGDFRAGERTFQLLTQAAGRAGRGQLPGEVVIQTYQPEHYAVVHASNQDYESFYQEEILYRELLSYPPVSHMLAVQVYAKDEAEGADLIGRLAKVATPFINPMEPPQKRMLMMGPSSASIGRINDIFRFVFYLKYANYGTLVKVKDALEENLRKWQLHDESVQFDFDPINTM